MRITPVFGAVTGVFTVGVFTAGVFTLGTFTEGLAAGVAFGFAVGSVGVSAEELDVLGFAVGSVGVSAEEFEV